MHQAVAVTASSVDQTINTNMIGMKEIPAVDFKSVEEKQGATRKCATLEKFFSAQSSPPESKKSSDLRSYFSTSSPPATKCLENGQSKSAAQKQSEKPSKALNVDKEKRGNKKNGRIKKNIKNDEECVGKDEQEKSKMATNSCNEFVEAVSKFGKDNVIDKNSEDVANCSFVSFEDFLDGGEREVKQKESDKRKLKKRQKQGNMGDNKEKLPNGEKTTKKRQQNVSKNDTRGGDKSVCPKNKLQKVSMKESFCDNKLSMKPDVNCVRTQQPNKNKFPIKADENLSQRVVAEIHCSPVSSPEKKHKNKRSQEHSHKNKRSQEHSHKNKRSQEHSHKNKSPRCTNTKRRSNVVVESVNEEIKVDKVDVQKVDQLPSLNIESKTNNIKSFPIFQKKTQSETIDVKTPVFSIFEKKSKIIKNDKNSPVVKTEGSLKRKINKVEKGKIPIKKKKKVDFTADSSTVSVDDFDTNTPTKGKIKNMRKKSEKSLDDKRTPLKLRRSQRCATVAESTPKKEFEVKSIIRPDGTIRMKIRAKKCDVKTATATKLLKKAKGQSAKVIKASKKSCQSVATKIKNSPTTSKRKKQTGTTKTNQAKLAVQTATTREEKAAKSQKDGKKKSSKPSTSQNNECSERKPPQLDEETLKARRAFLNKDALSELNRQTNVAVNLNDLQEPPFPSIPHILQRDSNLMWNLSTVNLSTTNTAKYVCNKKWRSMLNKVDKNLYSKYIIKEFSGHAKFSYEMQKAILNKLSQEYPKFPVRRIFKRYLAKCQGETEGKKEKRQEQGTQGKNTTSKQLKRKSELPEEDEGRAKRRRMPDKEETGNKTTEDNDVETKPVRRTRRKKNVITDDQKDDVQKTKDNETNTSVEEVKATNTKPVGLLWTEKYQPTNVSELIGNQQNTKKLQTWLTEWKKLAIKEKRKMKKEIKKKNGKNTCQLGKDWWTKDDDSDFDFIDDYDSDADSDDNDYDCSLCNTKILFGPSGSGKTAAVYACAAELGFKVFEVNASNRRTGKQILLDLGEATQSHHVARETVSGPLASFLSVQGSPIKLSNPVKQKTSIQNYFKHAAAQAKKKEAKKATNKSVAEENKTVVKPPGLKQDEQLLAPKKITSTSLILFKDVDIVFGDDKGFIAAINSFMETTKRPIIMTTSDPTTCDDFSSQSETYEFKMPSVEQVAVNLQLICLAENVLADRSDLMRLAALLNCDIRRCITTLQFWVESGASISLSDQIKSKDEAIKVNNQRNVEVMENKICKKIDVSGSESQLDSEILKNIAQHLGCFDSTIGLHNMGCNLKDMLASLKHPTEDVFDFCNQCDQVAAFNDIGINVIQNNIHSLLPSLNIKERTNPLPHKNNDHHKNDDTEHKTYDISNQIDDITNPVLKRLSDKALKSITDLSENMSFVDICSSFSESKKKSFDLLCQSSKVKTGLSDLPCIEEGQLNQSCMSDMIAAIQVSSYQDCRRNLKDVEERMKEFKNSDELTCDWLEDDCQDTFKIHYETEVERRSIIARNLMYDSVASTLPLQACANQRSLGIDYFPSLRTICQNEKIRRETQQKRRFLHYLDTISIQLKENAQVMLATAL